MREKAVITNHHRRDKLRSFVKQRRHPWLHLSASGLGHTPLADPCATRYVPPTKGGTCAHHRVIGRLHGEQPNWRLQRNTLSPSGHTRPWRLSLPKSASSSRAPSRATHAGRTFPVNQVTATGGPGGPRLRVPATRANPRHVHVHVYVPSRQDAQGTNTAVPWRHTVEGATRGEARARV